MKKGHLLIGAALLTLVLSISSCTKEQQSLSILQGSWKLTSQTYADGTVVDLTKIETIVTFFECNAKDNYPCSGETKTTTTSTNFNGVTTTNINTDAFSYRVHGKETIEMGNAFYAIDKIAKKDLTVHSVDNPLAVYVYAKQ